MGLAGASRRTITVLPLTSQVERRQFLSWQTHFACAWVRRHTHTPGLTPGSRQASVRLAEQKQEAAKDHTLGGGGEAISGSH